MNINRINRFVIIPGFLIFLFISCATEQDYLIRLKANPESISIRDEYAGHLADNGKYNKAINEYEILYDRTLDTKYKYHIGINYIRDGQKRKGYSHISKFFEIEPEGEYTTRRTIIGEKIVVWLNMPEFWEIEKIQVSSVDLKNHTRFSSIFG